MKLFQQGSSKTLFSSIRIRVHVERPEVSFLRGWRSLYFLHRVRRFVEFSRVVWSLIPNVAIPRFPTGWLHNEVTSTVPAFPRRLSICAPAIFLSADIDECDSSSFTHWFLTDWRICCLFVLDVWHFFFLTIVRGLTVGFMCRIEVNLWMWIFFVSL